MRKSWRCWGSPFTICARHGPGRDSCEVFFRYREARRSASPPCPLQIPRVFKACAAADQFFLLGLCLHADVIKLGFHDARTSVANSLLSFYMKCVSLSFGEVVFEGMAVKDSVSWNSIIHGMFAGGDSEGGMRLFRKGKSSFSGFRPNISTLVLFLQACWHHGDFNEGVDVHCAIIKTGFSGFVEVQNALMSMYSNNGFLLSARKLFDEMPDRDVVSWSVLIGAYADYGDFVVSWGLTRDMFSDFGVDVEIDGFAAVNILRACAGLGDPGLGRSFHCHLFRRALDSLDVFVGNSLIDMYSKCGDLYSAFLVFDGISHKNIVSWNSLLSGLVRSEKFKEALAAFDLMKKTGIGADEITLVNLLQCCKRLVLPGWCKAAHGVIARRFFETNHMVQNSVLDAYWRCGLVELAVRLFRAINAKNLVSWSTMIAGYAQIGLLDNAAAMFGEMLCSSVNPNAVTIISLLDACSSSADARLSKCVHGVVVRRDLSKDPAVAAALLNVYGKCAEIEYLRKVFNRIPERNILSWNTMIAGLGMNGLADEALCVLAEMEARGVKPNGVSMLSAISACAHGGLVQEGLSCFQRVLHEPAMDTSSEHFSCVIDMLGRAGDLESASKVIETMHELEIESSPATWGALLSACNYHGNHTMGIEAARHVLELEPWNPSGYLQTTSICLKAGSMADAAKMRLLMKERGVRDAGGGHSLVFVGNEARKFVAWDDSHTHETREAVHLLHHNLRRRENSCGSGTYFPTKGLDKIING